MMNGQELFNAVAVLLNKCKTNLVLHIKIWAATTFKLKKNIKLTRLKIKQKHPIWFLIFLCLLDFKLK